MSINVTYNFAARNITQKVFWNTKKAEYSTLDPSGPPHSACTSAFCGREALYPTFSIKILITSTVVGIYIISRHSVGSHLCHE